MVKILSFDMAPSEPIIDMRPDRTINTVNLVPEFARTLGSSAVFHMPKGFAENPAQPKPMEAHTQAETIQSTEQ